MADINCETEDVPKLLELCSDYVAKNIHALDSFNGFPALVAELIYEKCIERDIFNDDEEGLRALRKFTDAYGAEFLSSLSLNLSYGHVIIDLYSDSILQVVFKNLTVLSLENCYLGKRPNILRCIQNITNLQTLDISNNQTTEEDMKILLNPYISFGKGFKCLTELIYLDNPISNKIVEMILKLPKITSISFTCYSDEPDIFKDLFQLKSFRLNKNYKPRIMVIKNLGWGKEIMNVWGTRSRNLFTETFLQIKSCEDICKTFYRKIKSSESDVKWPISSKNDNKNVLVNSIHCNYVKTQKNQNEHPFSDVKKHKKVKLEDSDIENLL